MSEKLQGNPFAALFCTVKDAEQFSRQQQDQQQSPLSPPHPQQYSRGSGRSNGDPSTTFLESLLLFTTRPDHPHTCPRVVLPDPPALLTQDTLQLLLFERLLLDTPGTCVVGQGEEEESDKSEATRREVVVYLSEVYTRCWAARDKPLTQLTKQVQEAVVTNLATAIEQPELYGGQQPDRQLASLLVAGLGREAVIEDLATELLGYPNCQPLLKSFQEALREAKQRLSQCGLMAVDYQMVGLMEYYAASPTLATLLTTRPQKEALGRGYQDTPLGSLLAISCLARQPGQPSQFFQQPSAQPSHVHRDTEQGIWLAQKNLNTRTHKIFYTLLKVCPKAKSGLLEWVEGCLTANSGRSGLWHLQGGVAGELSGAGHVSDGFMVNLGAVMLLLAQPFTQDDKILKVDPTYCAAPRDSQSGAYTGDLGKQTPLVPRPGDFILPSPAQYSFITTCFFLTHRALHLGVQVVHQRLHKVSQELGQLQQEVGGANEMVSGPALRSHMESRTSTLFTLKAAVFSPQLMEGLMEFLGVTADWLVQVALSPQDSPAPPLLTAPHEVRLPLPEGEGGPPHPLLQCVPDLLLETLTSSIIAARRYTPDHLVGSTATFILPRLMSFIVVFMGAPARINNPHLRAHLAECLEILLPGSDGAGSGARGSLGMGLLGNMRDTLFLSHPLSAHLPTALTNVFVSIEVTGQSVAFEEKFNYRRPMYEVLKYLWTWPEHRHVFKQLAGAALANMEAATPPLFLRFVNLLINDAIFLLDEGLSYMSQLRESELQRENGEWTSLPSPQRMERERSHQHMTLLARFHNVLGSHTIQTLIRLTKEIPEMFTHSMLVDRMAAMLNYFLSTLVGPKQRSLKVRDMEKSEFRPGETVSDICTIYTHLVTHPTFCHAVVGDGRSYTPALFSQATDVLRRIGRGGLAEEVDEVGARMVEAGVILAEDEDIAEDAPEEFLDPIMSHLMSDPVILPSSKLTCDRQTIARHLLSDQTDPFNRQPLNMEEVQPNTELKERITSWLQNQKERWKRARQEREAEEKKDGAEVKKEGATGEGQEETRH